MICQKSKAVPFLGRDRFSVLLTEYLISEGLRNLKVSRRLVPLGQNIKDCPSKHLYSQWNGGVNRKMGKQKIDENTICPVPSHY